MADAIRQCRRVDFLPTSGWSSAVAAFLPWGLGMAASARQDPFLSNTSAAPNDSMLLYVLYAVPLTWLVASPWGKREIGIVHAIDGVLAAAPGVLFFIQTSSIAAVVSLSPKDQARGLVWLFDADHFKKLNDRHGHAAGDACLRDIAALLRAADEALDDARRSGRNRVCRAQMPQS